MASSFIPQAKLLRTLQIIDDLRSRPMSAEEIAIKYDMSTRTIYRYVNLFEEVGLPIEQDFYSRYFIAPGGPSRL